MTRVAQWEIECCHALALKVMLRLSIEELIVGTGHAQITQLVTHTVRHRLMPILGLEKTVLREIRVSGTVGDPLLRQKSPTFAYISQKPL